MTLSPFPALAAIFAEVRRHDPRSWRRRSARPPAATDPAERAAPLVLARDEVCSVSNVRDFRIQCDRGTLWITWPEARGDAILYAGEHVVASSRDKILILAIGDSTITVPRDYVACVRQTESGRRIVLRRSR